jgi:hypothetical protein
MTKEEAVSQVRMGQAINPTKEEYETEIRAALQDFAGKMIDFKQDIYAHIALTEVKRLDAKYQFNLQFDSPVISSGFVL